jgi:hypothetical protein
LAAPVAPVGWAVRAIAVAWVVRAAPAEWVGQVARVEQAARAIAVASEEQAVWVARVGLEIARAPRGAGRVARPAHLMESAAAEVRPALPATKARAAAVQPAALAVAELLVLPAAPRVRAAAEDAGDERQPA